MNRQPRVVAVSSLALALTLAACGTTTLGSNKLTTTEPATTAIAPTLATTTTTLSVTTTTVAPVRLQFAEIMALAILAARTCNHDLMRLQLQVSTGGKVDAEQAYACIGPMDHAFGKAAARLERFQLKWQLPSNARTDIEALVTELNGDVQSDKNEIGPSLASTGISSYVELVQSAVALDESAYQSESSSVLHEPL